MSEHDILSKIYGYFINRWKNDVFRYVEILNIYDSRCGKYVSAIYYFSIDRTNIVYQFFLFHIELNIKVVLTISSPEHLIRAYIPEDIKNFDILETINYVPMKRMKFNIVEKKYTVRFMKEVASYLKQIGYSYG